ncbi:hypothetical protein ONZ45_g7381 [Pleurotus djamor]|nr:hypothetical protein ONZ45_g7381 [Pleurotus djamor]
MACGRPKLYHTPEEKAAANRSKTKRYYYRHIHTPAEDRPLEPKIKRSRSKLYVTDDEKILANREKSKRSYHKNKKMILAKRARRHNADSLQRNKELLSSMRKTRTVPAIASYGFSVILAQHLDIIPRNKPSDVDGWLRVLRQAAQDFTTLTNGSTKQYMEDHVSRYLSNPNRDAFEGSSHAVNSIDSSLQACHDALLRLDGVNNNLKEVCHVQRKVRELSHCLDEVTCYALIGHSEVAALHKLSQLWYQSL